MKYEVRLSKRANRELASLEQSTRSRIVERLEELGDNPFSRGAISSKEGKGSTGSGSETTGFSTRSFGKEGPVLVDKIDHRSGVYGP